MKSLQKCKHCCQTLHYSEVCNSFVGKTYVRLRARLTFVYGQDLHSFVEYTCMCEWGTHTNASSDSGTLASLKVGCIAE